MVMGCLNIGPRTSTIPPEEEIVGVKLKDMEVGLNRSTTLPCSIFEKVLMELGEVDLDLGPALLPTIIQVVVVDNLDLIFMEIIRVVIGTTPDNFLHITMVD